MGFAYKDLARLDQPQIDRQTPLNTVGDIGDLHAKYNAQTNRIIAQCLGGSRPTPRDRRAKNPKTKYGDPNVRTRR